ncbi:MAG: undecaprenyl-phosphate galactose phosphotransferase WbaP [Leptospirales bacterium]
MTPGSGLKSAFNRILYPVLMIVGDGAAFYSALLASYFFRIGFFAHWVPFPFHQTLQDLISRFWIPIVVIGVFAYEGLYNRREPFWEETQNIIKAIFLAYLMIFSIVSLGKLSAEVSRSIVVGTGLLSLVLVPFFRFWWKPFLHRMGLGIKKAVLIGDNPLGRLAHLGLFRDHYMGIRILGFLSVQDRSEKRRTSDDSPEDGADPEALSGLTAPEIPCMGSLEDLPAVTEKEGIRGAVIGVPHLRREEIVHLIDRVQRHVLSVYVVPNVAQVNLVNSELLYLFYEEIFLLGIHNNLKSRLNRWIKALSDIILAGLLCIPLIPIMGGIAILIAATSSGPVIFSQWRMGRNNKPFRIFKFRTMYLGAEEQLQELLDSDPKLRKEYEENQKISNDPRITPVGRFLRKTSLDELPQIVNVLKGEMSLVGPRPVTRDELHFRYREAGEDYCLVKPGITGLWQVSGRSERGYGVRIRLDLWYIRNWSLWLDLVILIRTIGVVMAGKGSW